MILFLGDLSMKTSIRNTDKLLCQKTEEILKKELHADCHSVSTVYQNLNPIFKESDASGGKVINFDSFRYQYRNLGTNRKASSDKLFLGFTKDTLFMMNIFQCLNLSFDDFMKAALSNANFQIPEDETTLSDLEVLTEELKRLANEMGSKLKSNDSDKVRLTDKVSFLRLLSQKINEMLTNITDYRKYSIEYYQFYQAVFPYFMRILPKDFAVRKAIRNLKAESFDDILIINCFFQAGLITLLLDILKNVRTIMEKAETDREQLEIYNETYKSDLDSITKINACISLRQNTDFEFKNVVIIPMDDLNKLISSTEKLHKKFNSFLNILSKERTMYDSFFFDDDNEEAEQNEKAEYIKGNKWISIIPATDAKQQKSENIRYYLNEDEKPYLLSARLGTKKNFYWLKDNKIYSSYKYFISILSQMFETVQKNPNMNRNKKLPEKMNVIDILTSESFLDLNIIISDTVISEYEFFVEQACKEYIQMASKLENARKVYSDPRALSNEQLAGKNFILNHWLSSGNTPTLCLDMGRGKTRTAACAVAELCKKVPLESYILIIAPGNIAKASGEWRERLSEYGIQKFEVIRGTKRTETIKSSELNFIPNSAYITTIESFALDLANGLYDKNIPSVIIYDEVHRLTNSTEIQDRALLMAAFNQKVKYKLEITGTPAQNSYQDFYTTYCFFHNDELFEKIKNKEASELEFQRIEEKLATPNKFFYFGERNQIDSTKVQMTFVPITINPTHLQMAEKINNNDFQRVHQTLLYPEKYEAADPNETISNKLKFVKELAKSVPADDKIVVFCTYKEPLNFLEHYLKDFNPVKVVGSDSGIEGSDNKTNLQDFKTSDKHKILLTTIQKLGTGESLECANHLIVLNLWWNPAIVNQVTHRILRKSQKKFCFVYLPVYVNSKNDGFEWIDNEKHLYGVLQNKVKGINGLLERINKTEGCMSIPNALSSSPLYFNNNDLMNDWYLHKMINPNNHKIPYNFTLDTFYLSKNFKIERGTVRKKTINVLPSKTSSLNK